MEYMHLEEDKERCQEEQEHELLILDRKLSFNGQWGTTMSGETRYQVP